MDSNARRLVDIVRQLLVVPDKLVTAQLCLIPLSQSDLTAAPTESVQPVIDACELMHSAVRDVVETARNLIPLEGVDASGQLGRRFSVDPYYRRGPEGPIFLTPERPE